jgi:hypothetical protein
MSEFFTETLQQNFFRLHFGAMRKVLKALFLSTALACCATAVGAAEQVRKAEEPSFLERYTNAAQDVILQGLKLVGVRYRLGGNNEDSGLGLQWLCSPRFQRQHWCFATAHGSVK